MRESNAGGENEREDESHELSSYSNHPDEKINKRTEVGHQDDEEKPEDFLG